jgi:hypothetical protein
MFQLLLWIYFFLFLSTYFGIRNVAHILTICSIHVLVTTCTYCSFTMDESINLFVNTYIEDIGYSMLFDEYEIYFNRQDFLIFSRVRSTSENIIKILSHKWNKFHIHHQSIEFSVNYIFFAFRICLFQIKGFRAVTQHNIIIKNMTSQSFLLFSLWK